jgi:hypothetical protein
MSGQRTREPSDVDLLDFLSMIERMTNDVLVAKTADATKKEVEFLASLSRIIGSGECDTLSQRQSRMLLSMYAKYYLYPLIPADLRVPPNDRYKET